MIREIIVYPNPILRKKSSDVINFDIELHTLLDDMNQTMLHSHGVGLAAVQVGILKNVLIINLPTEDPNDKEQGIQLDENLIEAINPKIIYQDGEQVCNEGCLSIPGFHEDIKRAMTIKVEYFNRYGQKQHIESKGFMAIAWQHEVEHLNGHVFIENLPYLKRKRFEKEWKKKLKSKK
ncbi:Peptide deformylase [hydrothermal vent metagenome]|uniref:Peptide deformylase n=1 Tax=hydrothermal vent metagenome TaxID=652676 RepID=A0A3B1DX17_9ZZZZ